MKIETAGSANASAAATSGDGGPAAAAPWAKNVPPPPRTRTMWLDARGRSEHDPRVTTAIQAGLDRLIIDPAQREAFRSLSTGTSITVAVQEPKDLSVLRAPDVAMSADGALLAQAKQKGLPTALYVRISDEQSLTRAHVEGRQHDYVICELVHETNIPLELVVAELEFLPVAVLKLVRSSQEAEVCFGVVEHGADGVVLASDDVAQVLALGSLKERSGRTTLQLRVGKVTRTEHIGMGYRACIDSTTLMTQEEGMLVGSTSAGGLLPCSETHYLPYMDYRPFRVNAGAVHSYVWCPGNRTHYLSELKAGKRVLVVNVRGEARETSVGRVKIEMRPLLLIEAAYEGKHINAIVQDDWHVRVHGGDGKPVSVTTFKPGDPILCYLATPGRHVGIQVNESIIEE